MVERKFDMGKEVFEYDVSEERKYKKIKKQIKWVFGSAVVSAVKAHRKTKLFG